MTTDRRKAILYLSGTLIIGILIGYSIPALLGKFRHRDGRMIKEKMEKMESGPKREWFTHMIIRIVKPDSDQVKFIRPLTESAATKIGELEKSSNGQMAAIMDSLKLKLQPILKPEQIERLNKFAGKANNKWRGMRGGDPRGGKAREDRRKK